MSAVVSALAIAVVVLTAGPLTAVLPLTTLAGVLIVVAYQLIRVRDIARTIRATRSDAAVLVITFLATLLLSIGFAVFIGILLSIGLHLTRTSHPHIDAVVPDKTTGKLAATNHGDSCCQMEIVQIDGSLFFGSADFVLDDLQRRLRARPEVANLLIRMHHVNTMDASSMPSLEIILEEIQRRGGGLYFAGTHHQAFLTLKNSGLLRDAGDTHVHAATGSAIRQAVRETLSGHLRRLPDFRFRGVSAAQGGGLVHFRQWGATPPSVCCRNRKRKNPGKRRYGRSDRRRGRDANARTIQDKQ